MTSAASKTIFVCKFAALAAGIMLAGCMQTTSEVASDATLKPRDRDMLAHVSYTRVQVPAPFRRTIVDFIARNFRVRSWSIPTTTFFIT